MDANGYEIQHVLLEADTVATVTLGRDVQIVQVTNTDGAAEVYYTVDGAVPTVRGDDCHVLPATICERRSGSTARATTTIRLISAGTPYVCITGAAKWAEAGLDQRA